MRLLDKINEWIEARPYNPNETREAKENRKANWGIALFFAALVCGLTKEAAGFNSYWVFAAIVLLAWIALFVVTTVFSLIFRWIYKKRPVARFFYIVLAFFILSYLFWSWGLGL